MAFFEDLGKKVGKAAQAAAKKSSELVEITKLNANIGSETDKIQRLYNQIGKLVYEKYAETGEADENVMTACVEIAEHEKNIKELKKKIAEIKGLKQCVNCGAEMENSQVFCSKCGARNELPAPAVSEPAPAASESPAVSEPSAPAVSEPPAPAVVEETPPAQQPALFCTSCGAQLEQGAKFCTNCGTRVE
ncbi:MAG: zinc-ribbon domain-containing protein [Bacillota bacterium]